MRGRPANCPQGSKPSSQRRGSGGPWKAPRKTRDFPGECGPRAQTKHSSFVAIRHRHRQDCHRHQPATFRVRRPLTVLSVHRSPCGLFVSNSSGAQQQKLSQEQRVNFRRRRSGTGLVGGRWHRAGARWHRAGARWPTRQSLACASPVANSSGPFPYNSVSPCRAIVAWAAINDRRGATGAACAQIIGMRALPVYPCE